MQEALPQQQADRLMKAFKNCVHQHLVLLLRNCDEKHEIANEFVEHHHIVEYCYLRFDCMTVRNVYCSLLPLRA